MPDWRQLARHRLASLGLAPGAESDLVDEVAQHMEDLHRDLRSGGAAEDEAVRQALAELDDLYPMRASVERTQRMPKYDAVRAGEASHGNILEDLWKDLRYAVRSMRKNPVFVCFVVLTLSLGLGANTTVFTLINTLVLNTVPVSEPARLVAIASAGVRNTGQSGATLPVSYADLKDYRSRNDVFASLAAYTNVRPATWQNQGSAQGIFAELVTSGYFPTLGLTPVKGRFFTSDEDGAAGANPHAVISYGAWQMRLGGAEDIVGRRIEVNNVVLTVIGVAPQHFIGLNAIFGPDLWVPASMAERLFPNQLQDALTDRLKANFLGVGRLKPGVSEAQARANIETLAAGLSRAYHDGEHTATVRPLREILLTINGSSSSAMIFGSAALLVVVGIVLLIACSNVANLLLARSAARQQEMAVRLAMGASRPRLIRQLLTESVLLGLLSGATGLMLARGGLSLLFSNLPGWANFASPKLDLNVFAFVLVISLATGFIFGAIPAFKASRAAVAETLKEAGRTSGRSRGGVTLANALLVAQVAFSFVLLVTAALFLRSIGRAYQMDPGFQTEHLAVFPVNPGQAGYGNEQARTFYQEVRDRVSRLAGVESVSWSSNMPLWARSVTGLVVEGREERSRADQVRAVINTADRDYFETAGVAIESGRAFNAADRPGSLPVVIVNRKMAQDYWPGGALGRRIQLPGEKVLRQVVGVARTANYTGWGEPPQSCVYLPLAQTESDSMVLYVRTKADPHQLVLPVEQELLQAAPRLLLFGNRTGREVIDGGLFQARMGVGLLTTFGLLALGLASIGLYGVLAYSVTLRKREMGLRMALGASRASVLRLVLTQGMSLVMTGVVIGLAAALAIGSLLSRMLFGVESSDPLSVGCAVVMLSAVALLACYLPARAATRVDPLEALREP